MEAFLFSTSLVALAEMGDKTQLLTLLLAARFRKPLPIVLAILFATLLNHAVAALIGNWLLQVISADVLQWILAGTFIAMGIWVLIPDTLDQRKNYLERWQKYGVFFATFILFFLAEIGDKTQIATVALAAQFQSVMLVTLGTTFGMLIANIPMIFIGQKLADHLPMLWIQRVAAMLFIVFGLVIVVRAFL